MTTKTRKDYNLKWYMKNRKPCRTCGEELPYPSPGRKYCSEECLKVVKREGDRNRRARLREELDLYKVGLGCSRCGYNSCGAALDFHHPDENKERRITVGSWKTELGKQEIEKCVLLCANCHREVHHGFTLENGDVYDSALVRQADPNGCVVTPVSRSDVPHPGYERRYSNREADH